MNAFIVTQLGPPQPGWGLQHTLDLQPSARAHLRAQGAGRRTPRPTTSGCLMRFYRLTGETKFLARIPEALDWLEKLTLPPGVAPPGRTHPTFVELGTNEAALRASRRIERVQRPLLRRQESEGHHRALQRVPRHRRRGPAQAVRGGAEHAAGRSDQDLAAEAWRGQGAAGEVLHAADQQAIPPRSWRI